MGKHLDTIREYVKTTDKLMLMICVMISSFSCILMLSVYQAGFTNGNRRIVIMQSLCAVLGLVGAVIVSLFDYQVIIKFWPLFTGVAVLLMLAVMTPLGLRLDFFLFNRQKY